VCSLLIFLLEHFRVSSFVTAAVFSSIRDPFTRFHSEDAAPRKIWGVFAHTSSHIFSTIDSARQGGFIETMQEDNSLEETAMEDDYCELVDTFGCEAFEKLLRKEETEVAPGSPPNAQIFQWIRVEAKPDDTLRNIHTVQDVEQKIAEVRNEQSKCGPADLYRRQWDSTGQNSARVVINGGVIHRFSVMQFNALAEGLSSGTSAKTPFSIPEEQLETKGYGGFTEIKVPHVTLDFLLRRWRLIEVLLGDYIQNHDDSLFDIIAMEEVDRFWGFFAPILSIFGYQGLFMPKGRAPGVRLGWYSDGCALFWKKETFELVSERRLEYRIGISQVLLLATLRHRASGKCILAAVTHLKAQQSEQNEKLRLVQVEELLEHVNGALERLEQAEGKVTVLIMGDLNADPPSEIKSGESSVQRVLSATSKRDLKFQSTYGIDPPQEGFYTSWKTRGGTTAKRIIDYIFYSGGVKCTHTLSIPKEGEIEKAKLPGLRHPSDHMMIAARFEID
jgi:endonuclease/exonuclease/phosphatase family metal-dependent hydrolase